MMSRTTTAAMIKFCVVIEPSLEKPWAFGEDGTPGRKVKARRANRGGLAAV